MTVANLLVFALALVVAGRLARTRSRCARGAGSHARPARRAPLAAMWLGEALWLTCAVAGLADGGAHSWRGVRRDQVYRCCVFIVSCLEDVVCADPGFKRRAAVESARRGAYSAPDSQSPLGNPKIMVFYLALLPTIVDLNRVGTAAWIELTAVTPARGSYVG